MTRKEEKEFTDKMAAKLLIDSYTKAEKVRKIINGNVTKPTTIGEIAKLNLDHWLRQKQAGIITEEQYNKFTKNKSLFV
jgi:coenzyme F420-reducing hydrogenase alpha subunit